MTDEYVVRRVDEVEEQADIWTDCRRCRQLRLKDKPCGACGDEDHPLPEPEEG